MPLCVAYIALKSILNINSIKYICMYILCLKMAYMSLYEKQKLKYKNQNQKAHYRKNHGFILLYICMKIFLQVLYYY